MKKEVTNKRCRAWLKSAKYLALIAIGFATIAPQAKADLKDLGLLDPPPADPIGSPTDEADFIKTYLGLDFDLTPLTSGVSATGIDSSTGTASWDLTGTGFQLNFVLVKDGQDATTSDHDLLYRLYGVTADQIIASGDPQTIMIDADNDGVGDKGISHVTFLGSAAPTESVPEAGSTLLLLGSALSALGLFARRTKIASTI
jgi:hypothetical protein